MIPNTDAFGVYEQVNAVPMLITTIETWIGLIQTTVNEKSLSNFDIMQLHSTKNLEGISIPVMNRPTITTTGAGKRNISILFSSIVFKRFKSYSY